MEKRIIKITEDGSHTIYVPSLKEHYHSIHGAIQESRHIFIDANFLFCKKESVKILEFGMGTGLNILLTYDESIKLNRKVYYHSIDKYPLRNAEVEKLISPGSIQQEYQNVFRTIHDAPWDTEIPLSDNFKLYKEKNDFREINPGEGFDLVYFDAFAPEVQPEFWTESIFNSIGRIVNTGAILTTYSAQGQVKRNLISAGFKIEKLPGPPGKREFIRARKF